MPEVREWVLATPAVHMTETVEAGSAHDAIAKAWVSGYMEEKLSDLVGGCPLEDLFKDGYVHTFVFPSDMSEVPKRFDLTLRFKRHL